MVFGTVHSHIVVTLRIRANRLHPTAAMSLFENCTAAADMFVFKPPLQVLQVWETNHTWELHSTGWQCNSHINHERTWNNLLWISPSKHHMDEITTTDQLTNGEYFFDPPGGLSIASPKSRSMSHVEAPRNSPSNLRKSSKAKPNLMNHGIFWYPKNPKLPKTAHIVDQFWN